MIDPLRGSEVIRVLIVGDRTQIRCGLGVFLRNIPDLDVVGEVGGAEAADEIKLLRPDVILLDPCLQPPAYPPRLVGQSREVDPRPTFVVLSLPGDEPSLARDALLAGTSGDVSADGDVDGIVRAIRAVTRRAPTPVAGTAFGQTGSSRQLGTPRSFSPNACGHQLFREYAARCH